MACCAFAAFLVSQIYVVVQALSRWLRGTSVEQQVPSAALWRLDAAAQSAAAVGPARSLALEATWAAPGPSPKRRRVALISFAVAAELAIMIGGAQWFSDGGARAVMLDAARLASARSFADLKLICTSRR